MDNDVKIWLDGIKEDMQESLKVATKKAGHNLMRTNIQLIKLIQKQRDVFLLLEDHFNGKELKSPGGSEGYYEVIQEILNYDPREESEL